MFKKLLKAGTTFTLLLGCYFGYVRAFGYLVDQLKSERPDENISFPIRTSRSLQYARELLELTFGPEHWTTTSDLPYAYYNAERGFWMFALEVEEVQEEDGVNYNGKRLRMHPFAVIWKSSDGKNIQRLTAESATLDMNQPIALSNRQSTEGIKVKHAHIERDVRIRDDRGTPRDTADDMNVGPLTYLDFDDATQQITSESHVDIVDPDQTTRGEGLVIQLRKPDPNSAPSTSAAGFGGVEYAILLKNPRVTLRDVGNSGVFGGKAGKAATPAKSGAAAVAANPKAKEAGASDAKKAPAEPVPLYIQADANMRVDWPPDRLPVAEGPPAPPAPTLVRFERNVVALHGRADKKPDQLDCDTLRLTLVPGSQPAGGDKGKADRAKAPAGAGSSGSGEVAVASASGAEAAKPAGDPKAAAGGATAEGAGGKSGSGLFGNLALQKLHATGHAVWLQLRQQGAKVRCNELVHNRLVINKPDSTLFRGDKTRPIWLEKIDYEPEETGEDKAAGQVAQSGQAPNKPRTVSSVTHVITVSATLYDRGNGMDLADVRAQGPGRLETRPDLKEPVERVADWQDELIIVNVAGPDGKLRQKQVTLTGTRPYFVDLARKTSIDAGQEIKVYLKPKTPPPAVASAPQGGAEGAPASHVAARPPTPAADAFADGEGAGVKPATSTSGAAADSGLGGSLQIERLMAFKDVHLKAPNRRMEAREWLDAPFIEVDPQPVADANAEAGGEKPAINGEDAEEPSADSADGPPRPADADKPPAQGEAAAAPPADPAMNGSADRIWAKVALPRGKALDPAKETRRKKAKAGEPKPAIAATEAEPPKEKEAEADVREAWLWGNVALHEDVPPDPNKKDKAKPKGNDVQGEAVYLDNRGKGKVNAKVYYRDPMQPTPRPGPIPWARVSTDEMTIRGEVIWMDQEHDKIRAYGPGKLTQWTDRGVKTEKSPEPKPAQGGGAIASTGNRNAGATVTPIAGAGPARSTGSRPGGTAGTVTVRTTAATRGQGDRVAANDRQAGAQRPAATPRPRTRAGRPIGDKDLLTITWTRQMQFDGRSVDTEKRPAGRGDFFGIVRVEMTDSVLQCEQKMIVFTDREVPLANLGAARSGSNAADRDVRDAEPEDVDDEDAPPRQTQADLALIFCYGNPVAMTRKVDPYAPILLEQQRIEAWDRGDSTRRDPKAYMPGRLNYNRLTGEFLVPGPGIVYLYDRPEPARKDGTGANPAQATGREAQPADGGPRVATDGTVTRTSARYIDGEPLAAAPAGRRTVARDPAAPARPVVRRSVPPLVLMQVEFSTGMKGQMGNGRSTDARRDRWSEFYGNIEFLRSQVKEVGVPLNADDLLSEDGFFLTSQMLRINQFPAPPGSPENAPARTFAKAWDKVHVNKGEGFTIEADVGTYDSASELIEAYGVGGRGVTVVQQSGPGQPPSRMPARAVQYNVKTHATRFVDSSNLRLVDGRTGTRPSNVPPPDPTAPPKKKRKQPFKVPNTNLERRGFTGY